MRIYDSNDVGSSGWHRRSLRDTQASDLQLKFKLKA